MSVSERALRSIARDPETTIPALVIPVFMYAMTVGALEDFAENIPGLDYRAFQLPVAVMFAVTGISRATTVVTDIQSGYFDRLVMTPVNRLALLIGLMVADFALVMALSVPVIIMGFIAGVQFGTGILGILAFIGYGRDLGAGILRLSLRHRLQNRKCCGGKHQLPAVLPVPLHDIPVRAAGTYDWLAFGSGRLQSGYLYPGGAADPGLRRLGLAGPAQCARGCHSGSRRGQYRSLPGCPSRTRHQEVTIPEPDSRFRDTTGVTLRHPCTPTLTLPLERGI